MKFGALAPFPNRLGGAITAAASELDTIKESMGDLYTPDDDSLVGIERIAFARCLMALGWAAERLTNNYATPASAHDLLRYWAAILDIPVKASDTEDDLRTALKAKYLLSQGNSYQQVKKALQVLLGNRFVELHVNYTGDLSSPPVVTISAETSTPSLDLGNGDWISARCHLLVEVQVPTGDTLSAVETLVKGRAFDLLDRILPAYATFQRAYDVGFNLDVDSLDYTAMT